ncbi:MAG: VOC family protein [Pyrinomonadaceae bacterium]
MAEEASEMAGWALPEPGTFVWTEIASGDADKCQAFYESVFSWKFQTGGGAPGMDYREFSTGDDKPVGGLYQIDPEWFGGNPPPPHFMTYVAVDDVDANAELAKELGGNVHKVIDVPNVGRMAIIEDPTGAMFATFKMKN